jgi:hypothetical protein
MFLIHPRHKLQAHLQVVARQALSRKGFRT